MEDAGSRGKGPRGGRRTPSGRRTPTGPRTIPGFGSATRRDRRTDPSVEEIDHAKTPSAGDARRLEGLPEDIDLDPSADMRALADAAQAAEDPIILIESTLSESSLQERDATPLRVDLSDFGGVPLPAYALDHESAEVRMRDRYGSGDYAGALEAAEALLRGDPHHPGARTVRDGAREALLSEYLRCVGPLDRVPFVAVSRREVLDLGLDHRAGFVLAQVDGQSSFDEILDVTGMPRLESLQVLCDLIAAKIVGVR